MKVSQGFYSTLVFIILACSEPRSSEVHVLIADNNGILFQRPKFL